MLELSSGTRKEVLREGRHLTPRLQPHGGPGPACPSSLPLPLCAWPGWWVTEARRALMYCSAWCHSFWTQWAGTSGAWAGWPLQRCLWLTSQHGTDFFVPGEARAVPSIWLLLGYVPIKAYGEQQGQRRHCPRRSGHVLLKRAGAALGMGEGTGGTGRPWGWPKRPHNYKASSSCIAEVIQEIGLIGSCHERKLVPAGSRGGRQAAAVPTVPSCCQEQGRGCVSTLLGAGSGALLWGQCRDGDSLGRPRVSSPALSCAAVARLMEPLHTKMG